jgi:hypothetical protein
MQYKIEHRIGVPASSLAIWDVLSDLGRWPEWNTVYPEVKGLLRIQQRLTMTEAFPGAKPKTIKPLVVDWVPNFQIIWAFNAWGGLIKRIRYIEIEPLTEENTNCVLSNGEIWDGLLGPAIAKGKHQRKLLKAGFEQFNKDAVERLRKVAAGEAIAEGDRG